MRAAADLDLDEPGGRLPDDCVGGIVSFGNFDGLHQGHKRLIAALRDLAARRKLPAVVATFDPHPATILRPASAPKPLLGLDRKVRLLYDCGVDRVVVIRATPRLFEFTAERFWQEVIVGKFRAGGLAEGHDFTFGKDRLGTVQRLADWTANASMPLVVVEAVNNGGAVVSSTRIRRLLADGDLAAANALLGKPHQAIGNVVAGDRRGRTIGFPTANLGSIQTLLPAEGVYSGWAHIEGVALPAVCNVGPNPTFEVDDRKVEVHLLDFERDIYGQALKFEFVRRLRKVRKFVTVDALKAQLKADVEQARIELADLAPPTDAANLERELCGVIREWFTLNYGGDEPEHSGNLSRLSLAADGELTVKWQQACPFLPSDINELLLRLEGRLRMVFPEVKRVTIELATALSSSAMEAKV